MSKNRNFKIKSYDPEVAEKWKDLIETASIKGVLEEVIEVKKEQKNWPLSFLDNLSFYGLGISLYSAVFLHFGMNGVSVVNLILTIYFAYNFKKEVNK